MKRVLSMNTKAQEVCVKRKETHTHTQGSANKYKIEVNVMDNENAD